METGLYRPSMLKGLHDFTRLQDTLDNVAWFTHCCIATDLPDNFDLDVNTAYALLRNMTKPVATADTSAEHVDTIVKMLDIAAGGEGEFAKLPFLKTHISPVISPVRCGEDAAKVF
jgi:trimethylamine--corrinoid protein Co-methyltransferase